MEILFWSKESNVYLFFWTSISSTSSGSPWVLVSILFLKKRKKENRTYFFNLFLFDAPMSVRVFCRFQIWSTFSGFMLLVVFYSADRIFEKDWQTTEKSLLPYSNQQFIKHTISMFNYAFTFMDHILEILSDLLLICCPRNVKIVEKNEPPNLRN